MGPSPLPRPPPLPSWRIRSFNNVADFAELTGFNIGLSIPDGGNGKAETQAYGDDVT